MTNQQRISCENIENEMIASDSTLVNHHTGYAQINGGNIYYEVAGEGEAILFIHGVHLDSRMWEEQFKEFSQEYKVIRFDLRGFGHTEITEEPFSNYDDMKALLEYLDVEKVHVVGLSLGAYLALELVLVYPEQVHSLTLCSSRLSREGSEELQASNLKLWETIKSGDIEESILLSEKMWLTRGNPLTKEATEKNRELYRAMLKHNLNKPDIPRKPIFLQTVSERLEEIKKRTLIIYGELDFEDYEKAADEYSARIVNSKKRSFCNSAHVVNLTEPKLFNETLSDFIIG